LPGPYYKHYLKRNPQKDASLFGLFGVVSTQWGQSRCSEQHSAD